MFLELTERDDCRLVTPVTEDRVEVWLSVREKWFELAGVGVEVCIGKIRRAIEEIVDRTLLAPGCVRVVFWDWVG